MSSRNLQFRKTHTQMITTQCNRCWFKARASQGYVRRINKAEGMWMRANEPQARNQVLWCVMGSCKIYRWRNNQRQDRSPRIPELWLIHLFHRHVSITKSVPVPTQVLEQWSEWFMEVQSILRSMKVRGSFYFVGKECQSTSLAVLEFPLNDETFPHLNSPSW